MANLYVRSTDGSDADNGTTWALAKATLAGVAAIDAAGDHIFFSSNAPHSESTAGNVTAALAGTYSNPVWLVSGNDAAEPPTTIAAGAIIVVTGASTLTVTGSFVAESIDWRAGDSTNNGNITFGSGGTNDITWQNNCKFSLLGNNASSRITFNGGSSASRSTTLKNPTFKFSNASQGLSFANSCLIQGGSIDGTGTALTGALIKTLGGNGGRIIWDAFDASNLGSACNLIDNANIYNSFLIQFRNCKIPASWTGGLVNTPLTAPGLRVEMYDTDNSNTDYVIRAQDVYGSLREDTGVYLTAGYAIGSTHLSWKMVSTSYADYPRRSFQSIERAVLFTSTGSKTITCEILVDSATNWNNDDISIEVLYLGTSASTLGSVSDSQPTTILTTHAALSAGVGTGSWTGTGGLTNPRSHKLTASLTVNRTGYAMVKIKLFKTSSTAYVDPLFTVA